MGDIFLIGTICQRYKIGIVLWRLSSPNAINHNCDLCDIYLRMNVAFLACPESLYNSTLLGTSKM
jgi:hypothetical protein